MRIPRASKLMSLSQRLPFFYTEKVAIKRSDNQIFAFSEEGSVNIPSGIMSALILGPGCSITTEAMKEIIGNGCMLLASGEKGLPAQISNIGYRCPAPKLLQYEIISSPKKRMAAIKKLFAHRSHYASMMSIEVTMPSFRYCETPEEAMGIESSFMKKCYHEYAKKYGYKWSGKDSINKQDPLKLNYLNHLCYSVSSVVISHLGLESDVGILHGRTKGGGLVFDAADVFKPIMALDLAFKNIGSSNKEIRDLFFERMYNLDVIANLSECLLEVIK